MKTNRMHTLFLLLGLALCCTLSIGFLVKGPSAPGANEILAPAPALIQKDGSLNDGFLSDFSAWFRDRFFLRQELITGYARISGNTLKDDTIEGKDGWLFYTNTLVDYTGIHPMTERELQSAARNLLLMQEAAARKNARFLFCCVPNKNTLYPQYMPDYGMQSEFHNLDKLYTLLDTNGVCTLDLRDAFREQVLYFAHDSHWNSRGAALGADLICAALGKETDYFADDFSASAPHAGDLFEMRYPAARDSETDPVYNGTLDYAFASGSGTKPDSITIRTASSGEGSLLLYRDSFGNLLFPYLADAFESAAFSRSTAYNLEDTDAENIVIELVERNLPYLIRYVPILEAPAREIALPAPSGSCSLTSAPASSFENHVLWKGSAAGADADSPVYLLTDGGIFECFLMENDGFAAYLPEGLEISAAAWYINGTATAFSAE